MRYLPDLLKIRFGISNQKLNHKKLIENMGKNKIDHKHFIDAFIKEWNKILKDPNDKKLVPYSNQQEWTKFILDKNRFLNKVMHSLKSLVPSLEYKREYYTVDALYVGRENLFNKNLWYPSEVHVLIEHEMGEKIEEEMWKLIHWRSPLKILMFYDWAESKKSTNNRKFWLNKKLEYLSSMLDKVDSFYAENKKTEYLFIIGNQKTERSIVNWSWASNQSLQPKPIEIGG